MKDPSPASLRILLLILFTLSNLFLSYSDFTIQFKLVVLAIGILTPALWFSLFAVPKSSPKENLFPEFEIKFYWGYCFLILVLGIFLRFYRLKDFSLWPGGDEGILGMLAINLSEKWNWRFFYTTAMHPPLSVWISAVLFKAGFSPPLAFWLSPALCSLSTVFLAFWMVKNYVSKTFAFIFGCLFALSFWPLYIGRLNLQGTWLPLWVCGNLLILGFYKTNRHGFRGNTGAMVLGLCTALGSYIFTSWPVMIIPVFIAAFRVPFIGGVRNKGNFLFFGAGFMVALIPFLIGIFTEDYFGHFNSLFMIHDWFFPGRQAVHIFSYVSSIFWGPFEPLSSFGTDTGGMLNPLLGAFCYLGFLKSTQYRENKLIQWAAFSLFCSLLPGFLSMNVEMFRIVQSFPFLFFFISLGIQDLTPIFSRSNKSWLLVSLILISLVFDANRLLKFYPDRAHLPNQGLTDPEAIQEWRAQKLLRTISLNWGNGLIFTEFSSESLRDQSSFVMTYDINAAENPRLRSSRPIWAAVQTNRHFYSFLSSEFPEARWFKVGVDLGNDNDLILGIIPINARNSRTLMEWREIHHYFRALSFAVNQISEKDTYEKASQLFDSEPASLKRDRFIESCFWERRAEFYYQFDFKSHYSDLLFALRQAIEKGYPSAHLYYKLGSLYLQKKNFTEAQKSLCAALRIEPGYSEALQALRLVEDRIKETKN